MATCTFHPQRETGRSCTRCGRPACADCLQDAAVGSHCVACVKAAQPVLTEVAKRQARELTHVRPSPIFLGLLALVGVGVYLSASKSSFGQARSGVFVLVAAGWVVSLCLHEFAHAFSAFLGGDRSVASKGYLTLDPRRYTDPGLSLILPLVFVLIGGIGLPGGAVWINKGAIAGRGMRSFVSLAGPLANVVMGVLFLAPFWTGLLNPSDHPTLAAGLAFLGHLQFVSALLNLLPIPGLDGFGAIEPYLSPQFLEKIAPFRQYSFFVLFILFFRVPALHDFLWDGSSRFLDLLQVPDPDFHRSYGYSLFKFWDTADDDLLRSFWER